MGPMNIATTIIPIFAIIILGCFARWKGFIPFEYLGPANRLVYYLAIPAMIFHAISKASLKARFDIKVLFITLLSVLAVFVVAALSTSTILSAVSFSLWLHISAG